MKKRLFILSILTIWYTEVKAQDTLTSTASLPHSVPFHLNKTPEALGISPKVAKTLASMANPPINIALFGVDRRTPSDQSNSDIIIVISMDQLTGQIKMSSILRDTYVNIDGKGMNKINAAFALGGPQLAIKTINQNFDLDIKDYMNVDFFSAAKIVDALGGVDVNLKAAEVPYLNNYLDELAIIEKIPAVHISAAGLQKLNGKQTVAYTRIRAVGNGDYERTERQRQVLIALFSKIKRAGQQALPIFSTQILPNIETSMSNYALFNFAGNILNSKTKTIEQARFPTDTQSKGKKINNIWYLTTDLKLTTKSLHDFIYKNRKTLN